MNKFLLLPLLIFSILFSGCVRNNTTSVNDGISSPEQAVLVYLKLSDDDFGGENELDKIFELSDKLEADIIKNNSGEFDGNEIGEGWCTLYMYGNNADFLYSTIEETLKSSDITKGGYVIKRYGSADDDNAEEVKIDL